MSRAVMTDAHIIEALAICDAASKGPAMWAADTAETREAAMDRFVKHYDLAMAVTGSAALHQVDLGTGDDADALCMAVTGNGPTSAANARFIASAVHPELGWRATLVEVQRLREVLAAITSLAVRS